MAENNNAMSPNGRVAPGFDLEALRAAVEILGLNVSGDFATLRNRLREAIRESERPETHMAVENPSRRSSNHNLVTSHDLFNFPEGSRDSDASESSLESTPRGPALTEQRKLIPRDRQSRLRKQRGDRYFSRIGEKGASSTPNVQPRPGPSHGNESERESVRFGSVGFASLPQDNSLPLRRQIRETVPKFKNRSLSRSDSSLHLLPISDDCDENIPNRNGSTHTIIRNSLPRERNANLPHASRLRSSSPAADHRLALSRPMPRRDPGPSCPVPFDGHPRRKATGLTNLVSKWQIRYGGSKDGSAEDFLERLEDAAEMEGYHPDELLPAMGNILQALPRQWHRVRRDNWNTWQDFRNAFLFRFGTRELQGKLRDYLHKRVQAENETASDFIICLEGIAARLEQPITPKEFLDIAHENLLPDYRMQIRRSKLRNIDDLLERALERESVWASCKQVRLQATDLEAPVAEFAPPPKTIKKGTSVAAIAETDKKKTLKKKTFSSKKQEKISTGSPGTATSPEVKEETTASKSTSNFKVTCWNCNQEGHTLSKCPKPLKPDFCYKCHRNGSILPDCPRCSGKAKGE